MAVAALSLAGARLASAQEAEPNEFVPAPDGTNLAIGYYVYAHLNGLNVAKGPTINNAGGEVNVGLLRLVHFGYLGDMPAGVQIIQAFGSESGFQVGGAGLPSAFGSGNTTLSAFFWPYASVEKKEYFGFTGFINPPDGTYDKNAAVNLASAATGWAGFSGDAQVFWNQGIGENFSYDLAFDARIFGDTTGPTATVNGPVSVRSTKDSDFRFQAWANWNWTRAFGTSIGYEGVYGGDVHTAGVLTGKSDFTRVRFAADLFLSPVTQILLELNHNLQTTGGFKQEFGATARFVYVF